ncbi:MAG: DUF512 domain-containing protein [Clostridia bacterium]|nr:DUF512 domain-containing protein [Clostridia bacterium]
MAVKIGSVERGSISERKKIKAGDSLISINGNEINDVLDYRFYLNEKKIRLAVKGADGRMKLVTVHKEETEDIGLEFETYLMDKQHSCRNKCIFCFIDQLPEGLRDSLYFKDDDDRLSFLFGNYVTLTNLDDNEVDRIIKMHISPVNISVHTMNPELRVKMMANPHAGESLKYISRFTGNGIKVNAQLVLCPGVNDGKELEYSLRELFKLGENIESIACVPVGLTKYREGLYELKPYTKETAGEAIDIIDRLNAENEAVSGRKIAYAADEFYLYAERPMPDTDYYGDFPQLENGVGMWSLLRNEFYLALDECEVTETDREISLVTGSAAYPLMRELCSSAEEKIKGLTVHVYECINRLFGESITVSGLITGGDILYTLEGKETGTELIIPPNCLRSEGDMFLDNMTTGELAEKLGVKITCNGTGGEDLLDALLGN